MVGGEGERHAAGGRVAGERRDHQVRVRLDDVAHDVVDRQQVPPRLDRRVVGRLDDVEVDPVGEEVGAAHEHDDLRLVRASGRTRRPRAAAGTGRCSSHRCRSRSAGSRRRRAPRRRSRGRRPAARRARRRPAGRRPRGRRARARAWPGSLNASGRLEMGDPDRAVDGRPADRLVALGDDLARPAAQRLLAMRAEEVELRRPRSCRARPGGPRRRGSCAARRRWSPTPSRSRVSPCCISGRGRPSRPRSR